MPVLIKVGTSSAAAAKIYEILNALAPDSVSIWIGCGFDLKYIAAHDSSLPEFPNTFQRPRMGIWR